MDTTRKTLLSAALVAGLLAGCTQSDNQRIEFDGTEAGLREAVSKIAQELPKERRGDLNHALDIYLAQQSAAENSQALDVATPLASLTGIRLVDFLSIADRLEEPTLEEGKADHPAWLNPQLVDVMKLELNALVQNRERLNSGGYFTLDQMPHTAPSFIPPPNSEVRVENNKAIFAFRMSNNTGLTLLRPTFDVRVSMPGETLPVYTGTLTWNDPVGIPDGTSRLVDLSCCSIVREPYLNKRLRQLDESAQISVQLVSVEDYRKRNPLRLVGYSHRDQAREQNLAACIKDIELRIEAWTPTNASRACKELSLGSLDGSKQLSMAIDNIKVRNR